MQTRIPRVSLPLTLVLALASAAVGCSQLRTPSSPTPAADAASLESALIAGQSSAAQEGSELGAVRSATAQFHDVNRAYAANYTTENEPCVASPAGAMGIHAPNVPLILDQALDPLRPESLLYLPQPNGNLQLVGVEYVQLVLLRNLATQEVAPRFDPAPWNPAEFEIVNPQPSLFGHAFHLTPPPVATVPWLWALHVWIWAHNPAGMFEEWNPALQCP